ncbi:MAG TPA: LLM class flavin-dependent oxidoreductase [Candidatus Dormibacteraeota bacterium]
MTRPSISVMLSAPGSVPVADVGAYARHVEAVGLDGVFVADHLVATRPILDSVATLAAVAAVTERVRVGFGVMVPALRPVAWAAKQVATLQLLSGGRVILGVGTGGEAHGSAGWEAAGIPYAERGRRTDAALAALPGLIAGGGGLAPAADVPPIWVGGGSPAALRRAVAHGAAWFPSMVLADAVAEGASRLGELAAAAGRQPPAVAVGGFALLDEAAAGGSALERLAAGLAAYGVPPDRAARLPVAGPPEAAAERFAEYARAGAGHLVLNVAGADWRRQCELIAEARSLLRPG